MKVKKNIELQFSPTYFEHRGLASQRGQGSKEVKIVAIYAVVDDDGTNYVVGITDEGEKYEFLLPLNIRKEILQYSGRKFVFSIHGAGLKILKDAIQERESKGYVVMGPWIPHNYY